MKSNHIDMDRLAEILNYSSTQSLRRAIERGACPVRTRIFKGRRVATRKAVRQYLERIAKGEFTERDVRRIRRQRGWRRILNHGKRPTP